MDLYYKQEISVGLLVIVAIAALFGGLMWLTGRSFRSSQVDVLVQFTSIGALTAGDPVQISGVSVGRVAEATLEEEGRVVVRLEVSDRFRPKADARASIKSLDFLGAKYVEYSPGASERELEDGQIVMGTTGSDIAETATTLTDNAVEVLIRAQRMLSEQMAEDVRNTLQASQRALDVIAQVGRGPLIDDAQATFEALQHVALRLDSTLSNPGIDRSLSQLDELTEGVTEMTQGIGGAATALGMMLQQMSDTTGSLGRIMSDTTIHDDLHQLMVSMRKLLDDIRERPGRYTFLTVF
jgi:phospholipid/cholesterol/gamma-HCH transport system substrate-binding protein